MIVISCFSLILLNCAVKKHPSEIDLGTTKEHALRKQLASWIVEGSLAARAHAHPVSVQFRFVQCGPNHYEAQFFGPLRITLARIKRDNQRVTLEAQGKKIQLTSQQARTEFSKHIPIPLDDFKNWLKGAPAKTGQSESHAGLLTILRQGAWTLNYQNYTPVTWSQHGTLRLPERIDFANTAKGIEGKIRIQRWQLQTESVCRQQS